MQQGEPPSDSRSSTPASALVIGASGGIGKAIAAALIARRGADKVVLLSRRQDGLDLTVEASVAAAAQEMRDGGAGFDFVFNASGVLEVDSVGPEKAFRDIDAATMARAFAVNSIGAAMALKYFLPLLKRKERAVFATLSARVGSIGDNRLGGWMSYRASKAALNQIVRCAAVEVARVNRDAMVVALHPGTVKTALTEKYARGRYTATPEEAAANMLNVLDAMTPAQSGGFFDYAGREIPW